MAKRDLRSLLSLRLSAENAAQSLPALMLEAERIAASLTHGEHARRKSGTGHKFWQFRDYVTGDRPQDIDWRQSAKTDSVYIRQHELQTTQKTFFWCAAHAGMRYASEPDRKTKHDCAIILCLALGLLLTRAEEQIGLYGENKTGRSELRIEHIAQSITTPRSETLPSMLTLPPRHSAMILIGDFLDPLEQITQTFATLSGAVDRALVIQILDPAELDLRYDGRVRFEGVSDTERETINHVGSIRSAYQDRIKAHIKDVEDLCRAKNWLYVLQRTDEDITHTLRQIWEISSPW